VQVVHQEEPDIPQRVLNIDYYVAVFFSTTHAPAIALAGAAAWLSIPYGGALSGLAHVRIAMSVATESAKVLPAGSLAPVPDGCGVAPRARGPAGSGGSLSVGDGNYSSTIYAKTAIIAIVARMMKTLLPFVSMGRSSPGMSQTIGYVFVGAACFTGIVDSYSGSGRCHHGQPNEKCDTPK
jgi:hypothetical protein